MVSGCLRPARARGLCWGHHQRWAGAGKPDLDAFAASTNPGWFGHGALLSCVVADCRYGRARRGLCARHVQQWDLAGQPEPGAWRTGTLPLPPPSPPPASCKITYCSLWAQGKGAFCRTHGRQWKTLGCPDPGEFASRREQDGPAGNEHIDLRPLPAQLKLEMQYALQCRRDEGQAKIVPGTVRRIVCALAGTGVTSLLENTGEGGKSNTRAAPGGCATSASTTARLTCASTASPSHGSKSWPNGGCAGGSAPA